MKKDSPIHDLRSSHEFPAAFTQQSWLFLNVQRPMLKTNIGKTMRKICMKVFEGENSHDGRDLGQSAVESKGKLGDPEE